MGPPEVFCPDPCPEPIVRIVGFVDCLTVPLEGGDGKDRPEDLFAGHLHVLCYSVQDGRPEEIPSSQLFFFWWPSPCREIGSLLYPDIDETGDPLPLRLGN